MLQDIAAEHSVLIVFSSIMLDPFFTLIAVRLPRCAQLINLHQEAAAAWQAQIR